MSIHKRSTTRGLRYDVRLRTAAGRPYTRTFRTRDEAKAFERTELIARDRGDWIDPTARRRSFREIAGEWAASNPGKRASTLCRDRSALDRHILPLLGDKRIGSISPADIQALVDAMTAAGLGPASVVRNYNVAAAILRHACDRDYIAKTPTRTVNLPKIGRTGVHVFTPDELVAVAEAMPLEHAPMVWLGAVLGLRWGEAAALHVCDVDLLAGELHVRWTVTRGAGGRTTIGPPKSEAGRRTVAIPGPLVEVLAAHLRTVGLTGADGGALMFRDSRGGLLVASNWRRRVWIPAMVSAGLGAIVGGCYEGPVFHDLRRTNATGLVAEGVDIKVAQTRLGHSAARLTLELYAQAVPEAERRAAESLGARLMPAAV